MNLHQKMLTLGLFWLFLWNRVLEEVLAQWGMKSIESKEGFRQSGRWPHTIHRFPARSSQWLKFVLFYLVPHIGSVLAAASWLGHTERPQSGRLDCCTKKSVTNHWNIESSIRPDRVPYKLPMYCEAVKWLTCWNCLCPVSRVGRAVLQVSSSSVSVSSQLLLRFLRSLLACLAACMLP